MYGDKGLPKGERGRFGAGRYAAEAGQWPSSGAGRRHPRVMTPYTRMAAKVLLEEGRLTVREVAQQIGISVATLYKHISHSRMLSF